MQKLFSEPTTCPICEGAATSYDGKPFVPPKGSVSNVVYICRCGKKWWQFNVYYHLWKEVTDEREWQVIWEEARRGWR